MRMSARVSVRSIDGDRQKHSSRRRRNSDWTRSNGEVIRRVNFTAVLLHIFVSALKSMERVKGIEPSSQAWEARILPLNHTRAAEAVVVYIL